MNDEEELEAEEVEEESVQRFPMKLSPNDNIAGIGVMQQIPKKRSSSASHSTSSPNEKKKLPPPEVHYSNAEASNYIYKLAAVMGQCMEELKNLKPDLSTRTTQEKLEHIMDHQLKEVLDIKQKLLVFAKDNAEDYA